MGWTLPALVQQTPGRVGPPEAAQPSMNSWLVWTNLMKDSATGQNGAASLTAPTLGVVAAPKARGITVGGPSPPPPRL